MGSDTQQWCEIQGKIKKTSNYFLQWLQFLWILKHIELQNQWVRSIHLQADLRKLLLFPRSHLFFFYKAWSVASKAMKLFHLCSANILQYCSSWTPETWECNALPGHRLSLWFQLTGFPSKWSGSQRETHHNMVFYHIQTPAYAYCTRQCYCSSLMVNLNSCNNICNHYRSPWEE